jgi:hypothetical protein
VTGAHQVLDRTESGHTEIDAEALFEEARRRRRRRRLLVLGLVVIAIAGLIRLTSFLRNSSTPPTGHATRPPPSASTPTDLPTGRAVDLRTAGPLAVAPDGGLYVVDVSHDQVVVRRPDGTFRVVAGDGTRGLSGDGGRALDAELSGVSAMTFGPNGVLYLADGSRVRVVTPTGRISTVVGDGASGGPVADGTPALSASLGPVTSVALSPSGQLYFSTDSQILRLSASDQVQVVPAEVPSGLLEGPLTGFGSIAVDAQGDVDASCTTGGWTVWRISSAGVATLVGFDRGSGGKPAVMQSTADGAIYADGNEIVGGTLERNLTVPADVKNFLWMDYFAFGPGGAFFADDLGPPAFETYQQIVEVTGGRGISLWRGPGRSVSH